MRLLVLAAFFYGAAAFNAPHARGLAPRGPRVEHAARPTRRPIAPLMSVEVDSQDPVRLAAEVDHQDQDGRTALQVAAGLGHPPVVKALIAAGADVNKPTKEGMTALMLAASVGNTEMVEILLDAGANPELQDGVGTTALLAAAYNGFPEVVEVLLQTTAESRPVAPEVLDNRDVGGDAVGEASAAIIQGVAGSVAGVNVRAAVEEALAGSPLVTSHLAAMTKQIAEPITEQLENMDKQIGSIDKQIETMDKQIEDIARMKSPRKATRPIVVDVALSRDSKQSVADGDSASRATTAHSKVRTHMRSKGQWADGPTRPRMSVLPRRRRHSLGLLLPRPSLSVPHVRISSPNSSLPQIPEAAPEPLPQASVPEPPLGASVEEGPSSRGEYSSTDPQDPSQNTDGSFQPVFSRNIRREAHAASAPPDQAAALREQLLGNNNQPVDDDQRNRSPGLQNNFYEKPISDFKMPYGATAAGPVDAEGLGGPAGYPGQEPDAYGEPPPGSDPQSQQQQQQASAKSRLRPAELMRIAREEAARREAINAGPLQELLKTRKARKEALMNKSRQQRQQGAWQKPPTSQFGNGATGQPTQPRPGVKPLGPLAPKVYRQIRDHPHTTSALRRPIAPTLYPLPHDPSTPLSDRVIASPHRPTTPLPIFLQGGHGVR